MKILAILNPMAGSGKTRMTFNLGWMFREAGFRVILADLDPQQDLTKLSGVADVTVDIRPVLHEIVRAVVKGDTDGGEPPVARLASDLFLVRGDLALSAFEDDFALAWSGLLNGTPRALTVSKVFRRLLQSAASGDDADLVLCDLASNLGPVNRAVCLAADGLVIPVVPHPSSIGALTALGMSLNRWRRYWSNLPLSTAEASTQAEAAHMPFSPLGYVIVHRPGSRRIASTSMMIDTIASVYHEELRVQPPAPPGAPIRETLQGLATINAYPSLDAMAQAVCKPSFKLSAADGAIGSHGYAVKRIEAEYAELATQVALQASLLDTDTIIMKLEQALASWLRDAMPQDLLDLSSNTTVELVENIEVSEIKLNTDGLHVKGRAQVCVDLEYGGGEAKDGVNASDTYPLQFDVTLHHREEEITFAHRMEVDTSSFYE